MRSAPLPLSVVFCLITMMALAGCASTQQIPDLNRETTDLQDVVEDVLTLEAAMDTDRVLVVFDLDNTLLAMEQGLVAFFQPHLPGMQGASIALCIELEQILGAHSTDIPQHVAERLTVGIVAGQLCVDHDPGKLMQVHGDRRQRRVVDSGRRLNGNRRLCGH